MIVFILTYQRNAFPLLVGINRLYFSYYNMGGNFLKLILGRRSFGSLTYGTAEKVNPSDQNIADE